MADERVMPVPDGEWMPHVEVKGNTVTFTVQQGPRRVCGENGCQVDRLVQFARLMLQRFNRFAPSRENALAITKLEEAEMWLDARTRDRIVRGVEGTYQP